MPLFSGKEGLPKDTGKCGVPASHTKNHFMFMKLVPIFNPSPLYTPMIDGFYWISVLLFIFEHVVSSPAVW